MDDGLRVRPFGRDGESAEGRERMSRMLTCSASGGSEGGNDVDGCRASMDLPRPYRVDHQHVLAIGPIMGGS